MDGSLKSDANKGVTNIIYNYLGLQDEIQFGENQKIKNIYTADGIKLVQLLINGSTTIRTDYIGGLIYRNDTLISISHDEGIIKRKSDGSYKYQYFITDHLGNNRVIFEKLNDTVYVAQRADYYAFGGLMEGLSSSLDSTSWNFLFQGKEYVDAFGYNSYDFHARGYDANLGRFDGIDPVDNYMLSGYAGMMNNPTAYIDPDGRNPIMIGFMIGMFASSINHMIKGTMPKNMWDFVKPGVIGAIGGTFGAFAPNPLITSAGKNIAYGAFSGAVTGGVSDLLNGGNGSGALFGAITGGVGAGISWNMANNELYAMLHNPETALAGGDPKYFGGHLNEVQVRAKSNFTLMQEAKQRNAMFLGAIATYDMDNFPKQTFPRYEHTGAINHSYPEAMFMPIPRIGFAGAGGNLWRVGPYNNLRGVQIGLDAHHVGQRALMKRFVAGYDEMTAPAILVPKTGHTVGAVVSRSTSGFTNARQVLARDIFELRRVYGSQGIPNSSLQELINMNKNMYPGAFVK